MFDNEAEIRRFLLAGKRGSAAEAYEALGMSKASYYRKINWIVDCVMSAKLRAVAHQKAADEQADSECKTRLLELVLKHPTWGCKRFAGELEKSYATRVTSNMVANLLIALSLNTRRERIEKLMEAVIGGQVSELSAEQMEAIAEVNPLVNDALLLRAPDELVIGTTLVPVFDLLGPYWYLQLFVELRSLFAFGRFIQKTQDAHKNLLIGHQNESDLALLQSMCKKNNFRIIWATHSRIRHDISAYRPLAEFNGSMRVFRTATPPAGLAMMRSRIRAAGLLLRSPAGDAKDATPRGTLHQWFAAHNVSPTENIFPTAGRKPLEVLGLNDEDMNIYLAQTTCSEKKIWLPWEKQELALEEKS